MGLFLSYFFFDASLSVLTSRIWGPSNVVPHGAWRRFYIPGGSIPNCR
ncbi:hypothetical protein CGRA01v4_01373 [Colletotrichum graminicola]|nr:hypothetical protein CGRA01v4_01373 [Colletotrichum graminicola]